MAFSARQSRMYNEQHIRITPKMHPICSTASVDISPSVFLEHMDSRDSKRRVPRRQNSDCRHNDNILSRSDLHCSIWKWASTKGCKTGFVMGTNSNTVAQFTS